MNFNTDKNLKISVTLVCWAIILIAIIYFIRYFYDLFAILAISLAVTYILLWPIKAIEGFLPDMKFYRKRLIAATTTYVLASIIITITCILLIKPVSMQIIELSQTLPRDVIKLQLMSTNYIRDFTVRYGLNQATGDDYKPEKPEPETIKLKPDLTSPGDAAAKQFTIKFYRQFENFAKHGATAIPVILSGTFRNLIYTILIVILSFCFVLSEKNIRKWLHKLLTGTPLEKITEIERRIHQALIGYIRGQAIIGFITGLFMGIIYYLFGLQYALVLAIFVGAGQFVPFIGQALGIMAALIVAIVQDPVSALFIFLIFTAFQIFSNNILVPILLGDMTGMNPVIVILSLIIGERIAGILGVFLAVPVASIIMILITHLYPQYFNNNKADAVSLPVQD